MSTLQSTDRRPSSCGRPRRVTDAMIAEILAWHAARLTNAQKAAQLGISKGTLQLIITKAGRHYKQPSPEHRAAIIRQSQQRRAQLRAAHWL